MVLAGQFLERPALIDADGLTLEGLYHRGARRPALLVCPPLGAGGGMDAPPVAELAWAAARAGHPSLRFQHRGFGASGGEPDPGRALEDAEAAHRHLAETTGPRIALAALGSGAGTAIALARAHPGIARVVLVAPEGAAAGPLAAGVLVLLPESGVEEGGWLAAGARVEVVSGADRLFRSGLPALGQATLSWIVGGGDGR